MRKGGDLCGGSCGSERGGDFSRGNCERWELRLDEILKVKLIGCLNIRIIA